MATLYTILRRLFYTAAALSTLLLLATLILWPVSYYRDISACFVAAPHGYGLGAEGGRVNLIYSGSARRVTPGTQFFYFDFGKTSPGAQIQWNYLTWNRPVTTGDTYLIFGAYPSTTLGITWFHSPGTPSFAILFIPFSYLTLLFAILPLLAFRSLRRGKSARLGLCPKCHYDLRAHAAGSTCPECGTPVTSNHRNAGVSRVSSAAGQN